MTAAPPIRFYLPEKIPADMPQSPDIYWTGFKSCMRSGVYAWSMQTFLRLRESGFPCVLVHEIPSDGIMVAHRKSVARKFKPGPGLLFVCLKADGGFHPYAHLHVVLNRRELSVWHPAVYMPHWPQAGLIPRDPARGDRFEAAAFFGEAASLAPELREPAWEKALAALGLTWNFVAPERWNDFSGIDVVVAARSFDKQRWAYKPPTKLYNAWHAGVPAVLGRELAYRDERKCDVDYIEAGSVEAALTAIRKLRDDPSFRHAMVENGKARARETAPSAITSRWRAFFAETALPAWDRWQAASGWDRRMFGVRGLLKRGAGRLHEDLYTFARRLRA